MPALHVYIDSKLIYTVPEATVCPRVGECVEFKMATYEVLSVTHNHDTNSVVVILEE